MPESHFETYIDINKPENNPDKNIQVFVLETTPKSSEEWLTVLRSLPESVGFNGNPAHAAVLLESFLQGMAWTRDKFREAGAKEITFPKLAFRLNRSTNEKPPGGLALTANMKPPRVIFETGMLNYLSRYNPTDRFEAFNPGGSLNTVSNILNHCLLVGIEEYHHAAIEEGYALSRGKKLNINTQHLRKYEADDKEYYALQMQLRYAQDHNFPQETIQALKNNLNVAYNFRLAHGVK